MGKALSFDKPTKIFVYCICYVDKSYNYAL